MAAKRAMAASMAAAAAGSFDNAEIEALVRASGKMLLLHKLLPKLKSEGHQVNPSGTHMLASKHLIQLLVLQDHVWWQRSFGSYLCQIWQKIRSTTRGSCL